MPTPDTTVLDLIRAGSYAAAIDALKSGWPTTFLDTVAALCLYSVQAYQATSGSSVTIGTGSKSFTLSSPHGWPDGLPVRIMEATAPATRFMVGKLSGAETALGVITVAVDAVTGSGTYTSWVIVPLDSATTVAAPPLGEAGGGFAATTFAGGRTNMELIRRRSVKGVAGTPPGSPATNDLWAVAGTLTGAWVGHAGDWALWTGSAWTFEVPNNGDLSLDVVTSKTWTHSPGTWQLLAAESAGTPVSLMVSAAATLDATVLAANVWTAYLCLSGAPFTLTLPTAISCPGVIVTLVNLTASSVTFNVSGGGTINSATSVAVVAGASIRLHSFNNVAAGQFRWLSF